MQSWTFYLIFGFCTLGRPILWAQGVEIEGVLIREQGQVYLLTQQQDRLPIRATTQDVIRSLEKLDSGDFVKGFGEKLEAQVLLSSIRTIGLYRLLGRWVSKDGELLEFEDYEWGRRVLPGLPFVRPETEIFFDYSIVSQSMNGWKCLLRSARSIDAVVIEILAEAILVTFFDEISGTPRRTIEYRKMTTSHHAHPF